MERKEEDRRRAIRKLKVAYDTATSLLDDWNTMGRKRKEGKFWVASKRSGISESEAKIALMNFEPQPVSSENDDAEMAMYSGSTSNKSKMPDLIAADAKTSQPKKPLMEEIQRIQGEKSWAPFLVLVQSSGYGKTRTVLEVAKTQRAVYLLCSDTNGGWSRPTVMAAFVERITTEPDEDIRSDIARNFLQAVIRTAERHDSPMDLFNAQFTADGYFSGFYHELENSWKDSHSTFTEPIRTTSEDESKRLVVAFDESSVLAAEDQEKGKSACRCIRRNLRALNIVGIFLDTFGAINLFFA